MSEKRFAEHELVYFNGRKKEFLKYIKMDSEQVDCVVKDMEKDINELFCSNLLDKFDFSDEIILVAKQNDYDNEYVGFVIYIKNLNKKLIYFPDINEFIEKEEPIIDEEGLDEIDRVMDKYVRRAKNKREESDE